VKQRCASVAAARLDPEAVFALLRNLPALDPPSPELGVARGGASWEPLSVEEHRARVEANRDGHSAA